MAVDWLDVNPAAGGSVSTFCIFRISVHRPAAKYAVGRMEKTLNSARNVLLCQMLQDTRIAVGLTQVQLAAKLSVHQTEVSRVERGITRVDLLELCDFLVAMDVPLLEFVAELEGRLKAMSQRNRLAAPARRRKG